MKNIIVGQSGGPTAVINASLYGVITEGKRYPDLVGCVYGMHNGIEGFLKESVRNLKRFRPGITEAYPCRLSGFLSL